MPKGFCAVASFNQTVPSRSALFFAYLRFAVSRVLLLLSCAVMQVRVCERAFLCALCLSPADCLACECRLNEKVKGSLRRTTRRNRHEKIGAFVVLNSNSSTRAFSRFTAPLPSTDFNTPPASLSSAHCVHTRPHISPALMNRNRNSRKLGATTKRSN